MTRSRRQAMRHAALADAYPAGYCARWTREQYGIGPAGDADRDGDVDAMDSWRRATRKHTDRNPPPGVPVYWSGGRSGYGHIAMAWDSGRIRGTDSPTMGRVGTVDLGWVERNWGLRYLGWSEDLNGVLIPTDAPKPVAPKWAQEIVDKLKRKRDKATDPDKRRLLRDALKPLRKYRK